MLSRTLGTVIFYADNSAITNIWNILVIVVTTLTFIFIYYSVRAWYEERSEVHFLKSGLPFKLGCPNNSELQGSPLSISILNMIPWNSIRSPGTVLMVRWMKSMFEFDQPYKTNKKQNACNRIFYAISKIILPSRINVTPWQLIFWEFSTHKSVISGTTFTKNGPNFALIPGAFIKIKE